MVNASYFGFMIIVVLSLPTALLSACTNFIVKFWKFESFFDLLQLLGST